MQFSVHCFWNESIVPKGKKNIWEGLYLNIPPVSDKDLLLCLLQRICHILHVLLPIHIPETHTQAVKSVGNADSPKLTLSPFLKLNYIIFIIQGTSMLIGLNAATMKNKSSAQTRSKAAALDTISLLHKVKRGWSLWLHFPSHSLKLLLLNRLHPKTQQQTAEAFACLSVLENLRVETCFC